MPDPQSLPALIRAKYPGVYDDLSDQELDAKVRAKFPGVYDDLPKPTQTAAPPSLKVQGSGLDTMRSAFETAKDLGAGFAKAAGRSVKAVADDLPHAFGGAGLSDYIDLATGRPKGTSYQMVNTGLQSANPTQTVGGLAETGAELALPIAAGVSKIPTTTKAGALFNEVAAATKNVPVDTAATEAAAMRVKEAVSRGAGSLPGVVKKFIDRLDEPIRNAGPMMFDESREFASNLGDLTVKDYQSLNATGKAAVVQMWAALAKANADVAYSVGKGAEYAKAMNMYAKAKRMETALATVGAGIKKALPFGLGGGIAGAAYEGAKKLFGGE